MTNDPFKANWPIATPSGAGPASTALQPPLGGPEADLRFRQALVREAGEPRRRSLAETLARLVGSWFAPVTGDEFGGLTGVDEGRPVALTVAAVRDRLRRGDLGAQLGFPVSDGEVLEALTLVGSAARAEAERAAVAADHRAEHARVEPAEDVERAERRAELLRELAGLDGPPPPVPAAPLPGPSRWRRRT